MEVERELVLKDDSWEWNFMKKRNLARTDRDDGNFKIIVGYSTVRAVERSSIDLGYEGFWIEEDWIKFKFQQKLVNFTLKLL